MTAVSTAPTNGIDRLERIIGAASRQTRPCHCRGETVLIEEEFKRAYYGVMGSFD